MKTKNYNNKFDELTENETAGERRRALPSLVAAICNAAGLEGRLACAACEKRWSSAFSEAPFEGERAIEGERDSCCPLKYTQP
jgi:hypothetical protein